jgi:hypothetical protein
MDRHWRADRWEFVVEFFQAVLQASGILPVPVTWSFSPTRCHADLTFVDPYTIFEWQQAMLGILARPELPSVFTMLVDRRGAASASVALRILMFNFIKHNLDQRHVRMAELISLPDLPPTRIAWALTDRRIGAFHYRIFYDRDLAARWLDTSDD